MSEAGATLDVLRSCAFQCISFEFSDAVPDDPGLC